MNSYETHNLNDWNKTIKNKFKSPDEYYEEKTPYETIIKKLKSNQINEISEWVLRQYFDEDKNKFDFWYVKNMNKENVLKYISDSKNLFPHTLHAVVMQFKLNQNLRKTLHLLTDDDFNSIPETGAKNLKSEEKLTDIAESIGGLSSTMINKITEKALQKFKRIYQIMESDEEVKFSKFYENLVDDVAESFTNSFFEEDSLDEALASLLNDEIIKSKDLNNLLPMDFRMLDDLFTKGKEMVFSDIKTEFVNDFWSTDRKNNLFQYSVSRFINPDNKSGRKKLDEKN